MSLADKPFFQIYNTDMTVEGLARQVNVLRDTLISVVKDVVVMKDIFERHGLMKEATYRELRSGRMLADHSSAGADPWTRHSLYPYTLSEQDFLREVFHAGEAEVRQYDEHVEALHTQT